MILKHVILSNIQLILVTVGTLESESLSDSLEQSTDRTRCCLLLWPIWGIRKNKIESDLVWSSFSIHYEITWLCWYQMAQPEICIDVTVMRKKDLSAADFSQNLKKWFSWLVHQSPNSRWQLSVRSVRWTLGLKFRKFYEFLWIKLMHMWPIER